MCYWLTVILLVRTASILTNRKSQVSSCNCSGTDMPLVDSSSSSNNNNSNPPTRSTAIVRSSLDTNSNYSSSSSRSSRSRNSNIGPSAPGCCPSCALNLPVPSFSKSRSLVVPLAGYTNHWSVTAATSPEYDRRNWLNFPGSRAVVARNERGLLTCLICSAHSCVHTSTLNAVLDEKVLGTSLDASSKKVTRFSLFDWLFDCSFVCLVWYHCRY